MEIDSFKYLSPLITRFYKLTRVETEGPIPWTDLSKPLSQSRFSLVTSGGLYHKDLDPPFNLEREREEPTWGDPSFRTLPTNIQKADLGVSHFHIYAPDILADMDILMPIHRFKEMAGQGTIGSLSDHVYSFMGYQGYPPDTRAWRYIYGPQVAERLIEEEVDCVLLTSA